MSVGFPDWAGSAAINVPVNVFNVFNASVGPTSQHQHGPFNVAGQSYAIKFDPAESVLGTLPFPEIEVLVTDAAGFVMDDVLYEMAMSATLLDCTYLMKGPLNGTTITVLVENNDSVTMDYNISINTNSTPLLEHTIATQQFQAVSLPLVIAPNSAPRKGLLGMQYRSALAAGASDVFVLPPVPGPVSIGFQAVTPANVLHILLAPLVNQTGYTGIANGLSTRRFTDANGDLDILMNFPRSAMQLNITNSGAGATDYRWCATYDVTSG